MKKIISVLLSLIIVFSVMPSAFAASGCAHTNRTQVVEIAPIPNSGKSLEEAETIYEIAIGYKYESDLKEVTTKYSDGSYICGDCGEKIIIKRADYSEFDDQFTKALAYIACMTYFEYKEGYNPLTFIGALEGSYSSDFSMTFTTENQAIIDNYTEYLKSQIDIFEENVILNGLPLVECLAAMSLLEKKYGSEAYDTVWNKTLEKHKERAFEIEDKLETEGTQENFDAYVAILKELLYYTELCLSGTHCELTDITTDENGVTTGVCSNCDEKSVISVEEKGDCKYCEKDHNNIFEKITCFFKYIIERIKAIFSFGK